MKSWLKQITIALLLSNEVTANPDGHNILDKPQYLENYSFDFSQHHLPLAYNTYGASVQLLHKYKLIPDIKDRYGAIVLNKVSETFSDIINFSFFAETQIRPCHRSGRRIRLQVGREHVTRLLNVLPGQ